MSYQLYPSFLYRDPLLRNQYLDNTRVGTPIILTNVIDENVEGDDLLFNYINQLDSEIFSVMPEGLNDLGQAIWESDNWKQLGIRILNESRKHGWCVVQFYDEDALQRWKVFSVQQFSDYIKETYEDEEGNDKTKAVGIKFEWGDYLGNSFKEELRFEDKYTHLIKFREGDGLSTFAFPDLSQAIMTLAFEIRQIKGQLTFTAAKPSYQHFVYGENADETKITELDNKIGGVDATSAIGAPEGILKEIRTIKNENIAIIDPALEKMMGFFAGVTRLPVCFYEGKSDSTGLSDVGAKMEKLQIINKKTVLFNHYETYIRQIFSEVYGISIDKLELPQEVVLDEVEEEDKKKMAENKSANPKETESETDGQEN